MRCATRPVVLIALFISFFGVASPALGDCLALAVDGRAEAPLHRAVLPPADGCRTRISHDYPVPDPACTPGATNPTVTLAMLRSPDFRTSCVRNKATSEHEKAVTYRWYGIAHPAHNQGARQTCELDHLVSLELGGADTLDNIWPQCGPMGAALRARFFKQKDAVENYLAARVRDGTMPLGAAQRGIAEDWT